MIIKKRSLVTCCAPLYLVLLSHATAFPVVASSSALRSCLAPTYYVAASTSSTATPLYPYHRSRLLLRYLRHAAVSPPHHPSFTQSARSEPSFPPAPMPCRPRRCRVSASTNVRPAAHGRRNPPRPRQVVVPSRRAWDWPRGTGPRRPPRQTPPPRRVRSSHRPLPSSTAAFPTATAFPPPSLSSPPFPHTLLTNERIKQKYER